MRDLCGFHYMVFNDYSYEDLQCTRHYTHNICNLMAILQGWCDPSYIGKKREVH